MVTWGSDDTVLCTTVMGGKPLREFCDAAGGAGFTAVSLAGSDYKDARKSGLSDADIRALFTDNNLKVAELDCIIDCFRPLPDGQGAGFSLDLPFFHNTENDFFLIADAVGARSVTVADPFVGDVPFDQKVEAFARVCDRAAEHGMLVHIEFLSWGPVPNLATGWDIVRTVDRPNAGLTVDTLHLTRSGSRELLRSIPGDKIYSTQYCDGRAVRVGNAFSDAADREMLCEGEFGLPSIVRDLEAMGCTAPIGFEVINPTLLAMSAKEVARIGFESLARLRAEAVAIA